MASVKHGIIFRTILNEDKTETYKFEFFVTHGKLNSQNGLEREIYAT